MAWHVQRLVAEASGHEGGGEASSAALEAALEAAVTSIGTCQQQQSLRLQHAVARLKVDFRGRLERRLLQPSQQPAVLLPRPCMAACVPVVCLFCVLLLVVCCCVCARVCVHLL